MIFPNVQAMTRVWEKSHDVSFNKQVALEDAHRQAGQQATALGSLGQSLGSLGQSLG